MSLRTKLLLLWGGLAVAPLLVIGVFEYYHSARSLRTLIASQVTAISQRAAAEVADGYARRVSDLLLVAENAETQRLFEAYVRGDGADPELGRAREAAEAYLNQAWELFGSAYDWMELRDSADVPLLRFGLRDEGAGEGAASWQTGLARSTLLAQPVLSQEGGRRLGTVVARVPLGRILPRELLETTFGRAGYSTVIDRSADRVLYHPRQAVQGGLASALLDPSGWDVDPILLQREAGVFTFRQADSTRVAAFTSLAAPPWTVIATGAVEEFAPAVSGMRLGKLLLVLLVAGIASLAFVLVVRTGTRSLLALTSAADQVGAGNFTPRLPEPGQDEVGRLTTAFGLMVKRVEEMVRQIEVSRHMAVVGEFASQISHEVRNPLTTLKLNLQTLQRAAERGRIPEDQGPAVETCLQEIQRLDRVVKGVLALGRPPAASFAPCSVHEILDAALRVARPQARQRGVRVYAKLGAGNDRVSGDAGRLEAAFLNLLLNGLDAAEGEGGRVLVTTENFPGRSEAAEAGHIDLAREAGRSGGGSISIRITDSGPGIDPAARDQIFRPFHSSKAAGSGFGLPLALRTIEEHRGRLELEKGAGSLGGAAFRIELPLLDDETGTVKGSELP